jgi:hypothetical protein
MGTTLQDVGLDLESELDRELSRASIATRLFGQSPEPVRLGRFELLRRVGRGAMGAVYEALDRERGARVALKLLSRVDARGVYRLKREFRSLVAVSHPNLIALDQLFSERDQWFFSMELVADGMWFNAWLQTAPASEREARLRAALRQLAGAVAALHREGKLHCDIKPSNVLVTPEARVVLLDFGLVTDAALGDASQSLHSGVHGTPAYLAPELAQGAAPSEASDWYAVGVMLYEALTDRLPFVGNPWQVLSAKQASQAPRAAELVRGDRARLEDLCSLCDGLLARDPGQRPTFQEVEKVLASGAGAGSSAPPRAEAASWLAGAAPFVGRENELAAMHAALAEVRAGASVNLWLSGLSGVGKSALLDRFVSELGGGLLVLRGACHEQESVPYKVFDEVVDALSRHLRRLPSAEVERLVPRHVPSLLGLFPALGRVPAFAQRRSAAGPARDARERRNEAFAALKELLLRLTDVRPVVIVVDDLQWGDADSARMFGHVLGGPEPPALLLLGAYRSDETERNAFLSEVLQRWPQTTGSALRLIEVGPLSPAAAERLAHELLARQGGGAQSAIAAHLAREANGLAFFIGELVRHHALNAGSDPERGLSLERAILDRVAALPQPAQALLQIVSVAGGPLEQSVALRAAALPPEELSALQALRAARLLRRHAGHSADAIETYHDCVRETVARQLDAETVRGAHARIAAALEALELSDPERLVAHHVRAGDRARAAEHAERAADAAVAKLAFNRAAELLRMAIELANERTAQRGLQRRLADALVNAGRGAEAAIVYLSAAEGETPAAARELQRHAAEQSLRSGRTVEGLAIARSVFAAAGLSLPAAGPRAIGAYLWQRARLSFRRLELPQRSAPVSPDRLERLDCMLAVFPGLSLTDPVPGAVLQSQFLNEALIAGEPQRLLQGLAFEAFNLALLGGPRSRRRAQRAIEVARQIAFELGTPYAHAMVGLAEASYHLFAGRGFRAALPPLLAAQRGFAEAGSAAALERGLVAHLHFMVLEFTCSLRELCAGAFETMREAQERDDRLVATLMLLSVPCAHLIHGHAEAALRLLLEQELNFTPGYNSSRHVWIMRIADVLNYLDRPEQAVELFAQHWASFLDSSYYRSEFARDCVYTYRARCALHAYIKNRDPAMLALASQDLPRLGRSRTVIRWTADAQRAALAWLAGDHAGALRRFAQVLPRFRADDGESFYLYGTLAHARLTSDEPTRQALISRLSAEGVHDPERWAWTLLPFGPRPQPLPDP